jgi:hypothetical protein
MDAERVEDYMIFKITPGNHLKVQAFMLTGTFLLAISMLLLGFNLDSVLAGWCTWAIITGPAIYLHIEYYLENKGQVLKVTEDAISIQKGNNAEASAVYFYDIERLILVKSASLDKGGMPMTPLEYYHYIALVLKDGRQIFITCLMAPNLDVITEKIVGVKRERRKKLFASVRLIRQELSEPVQHS